jgi:hypothetical protein
MALPLLPIIPLIWRLRVPIVLAAKGIWVGGRLLQNKGNLPKTFAALRDDVMHSYKFVTDAQYRTLKSAGNKLKEKGGEYATLADALLMLAELVTGMDLKSARAAVKQTGTVADVYKKLSPEAKATVQAETSLSVDKAVHDVYANLLYSAGLRLLDSSNVPGSTVATHLQNQYRGLYYIGRSGHSLSTEVVDSLAIHMKHFHQQVNSERDAELIAWYETVGVSKPENILPTLLADCPEVQMLDVDVRYIAYALHQPIKALPFDGVKEELEKHLKL